MNRTGTDILCFSGFSGFTPSPAPREKHVILLSTERQVFYENTCKLIGGEGGNSNKEERLRPLPFHITTLFETRIRLSDITKICIPCLPDLKCKPKREDYPVQDHIGVEKQKKKIERT